MSAEEANQEKPTFRRDHLISVEKAVRDQWKDAKLFEHDVPTDPAEYAAKKKFMVTFPYPYMNGALHLGHAFSVVKAEYAVRFQRLLGKHTLFPFGFHCTGMPILACAQKLQKEIAAFGNPPVFPVEEPEPVEEEPAEETPEPAAADSNAPKEKKQRKKKGKLAGKASKHAYQWQIMREMGVPETEIAAFQDPQHWLSYFPPIAQRDLNGLGLAVDWRRSFITTDVNPYYDAFIKWQFNHLRRKDKVGFGKLMCIVSPSNKQVCADHDRREGEGVGPQAYTLVKLRMAAPFPPSLVEVLGKAGLTPRDGTDGEGVTVVLPAATLRPETMCGQTNAFVLPTGEYSVFRLSQNEVYICTDRSAHNMAHQDIFGPVDGVDFVHGESLSRKLGTVVGQDLIGCAIRAPVAAYEKVYLLPLLSILMDKGTGIVTSVPSDSPADFAALNDLKNKPDFRAKFGVTDEMVMPFDVVPVLSIPSLNTDRAAVMLCEKYGVKSQNDLALIAKIKDEVYLHGFDHGIMVSGAYAGKPVKDVKDTMKADMIAAGDGVAYAEPESRVVARTDEECVAALVDQWFLKYGEAEWQGAVRSHVESEEFNGINKPILNRVLFTVGWLKQWGCSRAFGLGTHLPFPGNEQYLVESLSDSTIYMAYYTIAHFLQGGVLDGSVPGAAQVKPEQLTDALFDYVFLETPYDASIGVPEEVLQRMRREFEFWYPMDLRVSGKDLLNNHLIMSLYNHSAIWDNRPDRMPKSFYANGLLQIDNKKMSKSTGNFLTLAQALNLYGADATRFALASSGDSLEDANFSSNVADGAILTLTREEDFIKETLAGAAAGTLRTGEQGFWDLVAVQQMQRAVNKARLAYESMQMLDVIKFAFYELLSIRDEYRLACDAAGLHRDVMYTWMQTLAVAISPITPFWSQHLHELMQEAGVVSKDVKFVYNASWPVLCEPDAALLQQATYITQLGSQLRGSHAKTATMLAKKNKGAKIVLNKLTIRVATGYPGWQVQILDTLRKFVDNYVPAADAPADAHALSGPEIIAAIKELFKGHPNKKMLTNAMQFTSALKSGFAAEGVDALQLQMPFDELATVKEHLAFITRTLEPIDAETTVIEAFTPPEELPASGGAGPIPGKPTVSFGME